MTTDSAELRQVIQTALAFLETGAWDEGLATLRAAVDPPAASSWWGEVDAMMRAELPDLGFSLDDLPELDPPDPPDPVLPVIEALLAEPRALLPAERRFLAAARRAALAGRLTAEQRERVVRIAATMAEPGLA